MTQLVRIWTNSQYFLAPIMSISDEESRSNPATQCLRRLSPTWAAQPGKEEAGADLDVGSLRNSIRSFRVAPGQYRALELAQVSPLSRPSWSTVSFCLRLACRPSLGLVGPVHSEIIQR